VNSHSWRAKLERAAEHIVQFDRLAAEVVRVRPEDMDLSGEKNIGDGEFVTQSVIITSRPIPPRLSAIAGDAFHNLRSALDHIGVAVTQDERAYFPIVTTADAVRVRELDKLLAKLPSDVASILREAQPYLSSNPESHPLALLQRLDNTDKHRALMLVAAYFRAESAQPHDSPEARVLAVRLGGGIGGRGLKELFSLDLTIPQGANLSVSFSVRGEVVFADSGPLEQRNVVHVYQEISGATTQLVTSLERVIA
jgi:hypothetical protein